MARFPERSVWLRPTRFMQASRLRQEGEVLYLGRSSGYTREKKGVPLLTGARAPLMRAAKRAHLSHRKSQVVRERSGGPGMDTRSVPVI
jgi:hypothetical protein